VRDPREGVFVAINDSPAILNRLRSVTETSGTYRYAIVGGIELHVPGLQVCDRLIERGERLKWSVAIERVADAELEGVGAWLRASVFGDGTDNPREALSAEALVQRRFCHLLHPHKSLNCTNMNTRTFFEGSGNSTGNSYEDLAIYWGFIQMAERGDSNPR
jgi:hypothetical protein